MQAGTPPCIPTPPHLPHLPARRGCRSGKTACWLRCAAAPAAWAAGPPPPAAPSTCCGGRRHGEGGAGSVQATRHRAPHSAAGEARPDRSAPQLPLHVANVSPVAALVAGVLWPRPPHHHRLPAHLLHRPHRAQPAAAAVAAAAAARLIAFIDGGSGLDPRGARPSRDVCRPACRRRTGGGRGCCACPPARTSRGALA